MRPLELRSSMSWTQCFSVDLIQLDHTTNKVSEGKSYDLLLLMEIRRPDIDSQQFYRAEKNWSHQNLEKLLEEYSTFLSKETHDVLAGDFTVFAQLKKLSAHYWRQKNKEYFGTYCGETPRFSRRPSLTEVFPGAKHVDAEVEKMFKGKVNQDKTRFRIYEAYWNHQYSTKEIAKFLKRSEKSIKQELEDYDDRF